MRPLLLLLRAACQRHGLALLLALLTAPQVQAQIIYGLGTYTGFNLPQQAAVGQQAIIRINPVTGVSLTPAPITITGVAAGQTLVGMDFRTTNGLLYALGYDPNVAAPTANTQLYTLDTGTNAATAVGSAVRLELGSTSDGIGFDFEPTTDLIRVVSNNDANYQLSPTTGSIAATHPNLHYTSTGGTPANPGVGAAAYTNAYAGATTTTLYDIDYLNSGLLSIQNPPNTGALTTQSTIMLVITGGTSPGTYPVSSPRHLGLDIFFSPDSARNLAYMTEVTALRNIGAGRTSRSSNLYRLNLSNGRATLLGNTIAAGFTTNFEVRDIAVVNGSFPPLTWNGSLSTDWRTAANWTPAQVPTALNDVTILGGVPFQPVVDQSQQVRAITLLAGAAPTVSSSGILYVGGNFSNNGGVLNGSGTVVLESSGPQTLGGTSATRFENLVIGNGTTTSNVTLTGTVAVHGQLVLFGNLTATGQQLTLLSDAAGTAHVVNPSNGTVTGTVTMQRYIEPSLNAGLGYRHYSAPVTGSTVADLAANGFAPVVNAAYNTATRPGLVTPFPNVYAYNQNRVGTVASNYVPFDQGWESPASTSDGLEVTRGYTVNIDAATTVDFVGTLNNGPYTAGGLGRSSNGAAGWHLRGNPYPSPLDWDLMLSNNRLTNVDSALYVYKSSGQYAGTFATYINGQTANGGSNLLASGQAFFVRTSAPGATGSIAFTNGERVNLYANPAFQRSVADSRPVLRLRLAGASAQQQTVLYFQQGATTGFDAGFDAVALPGYSGLTLATEAGAEQLAINGLPALTGADVLLPLHLGAYTAGSYTLHIDALRNLPTGYHAYLRDALTGTFTDLATTPNLALTLAANAPAAGRYALLFTTQARVLATAPQQLAQLASVYPNPAHGTATLVLPQPLRGTQANLVQVLDNLGRVVLSRTLAAGATEVLQLPLSTLNAGIYTVQAKTAVGLVAKRLVVQ